ncbi:SRPBCC domain-containing protein [Roseibium sp. AS2]|uniref:SRPBCC family protein n=1 Tax=Roseibium sp. AS2 TaxID=3135781 RepID=UPI0031750F89
MTDTTLRKSVFIKAARDKVWPYLVDKTKLGEWYHPAEADLAAGQSYVLLGKDGNGQPEKQVWGDVLELVAGQKLKTTFCIGPFGDRSTVVTWVLEEVAGGTMIYLTHEGIPEAAGEHAMHLISALDKGWDIHLGHLRETGA